MKIQSTWIAGMISLVIVLTVACTAPSPKPTRRPAAPGEASVWVFLAPPSGDASRLDYRLLAIEAVSAEGILYPLTLQHAHVQAGGPPVERLLAVGALPPGQYGGVRVIAEAASVRGSAGSAELEVIETPTDLDVTFRARRDRAVVLSLDLSFAAAVRDGSSFEPAFDVTVPAQPAIARFALTACGIAGVVSMYDRGAGKTFAVVPVGRTPSAIVLSTARRQAYVTLTDENALVVIGLQELAVIDRLQLGAGDTPVELALSPDELTLLTANSGSGTVSVIDAVSLAEIDRIRVGDGPRSVQFQPGGGRAFVFNTISNTISVVDPGLRTVVATLSTEPEPIRGEFDRRGERLYVIHGASPFLTVIDPATLSVVERVYVGPGSRAVATEPLAGRVLLARRGTGTVDIYDPSSLLPVDFIPIAGETNYMAVDPEGNHLHVVLPGDDRVQVVRLANKKTLTTADVGDGPSWVALMGSR